MTNGYHAICAQNISGWTMEVNTKVCLKSSARTMGIKQKATAAQSNGIVEKTVGTAKSMLTKCKESGQDFYLALLEYRNTPIDQIGSPSQLLMS